MHTIVSSLDVHTEDAVPALLLGEVVVRRAPRNPRVVNEDVNLRLALLNLICKVIATCF